MHYEWIKEHLKAAGIDPNGYNIALAWNCGITAVINGRVPMQTYSYADRVNNLADTYSQSQSEEVVQVATTANSNVPADGLQFSAGGDNHAPEFKIVPDPFVFRVGGEASRFLIDPPKPRFVLVSN